MKTSHIPWARLYLFIVLSISLMLIHHRALARSVRLLPLTVKGSTEAVKDQKLAISPRDRLFLSHSVAQMLARQSNGIIEIISPEELSQSLTDDFDPTICGERCPQIIAEMTQADLVIGGEIFRFGESWRFVLSLRDVGADQMLLTETLKSEAKLPSKVIQHFERQLKTRTSEWVSQARDRLNEISKSPMRLYKAERALTVERGRWSELGISWIPINGAQYEMGHVKGHPNERPVHAVRAKRFQIMKTEVTAAQYWACVQASACTPLPDREGCVSLGTNSREAVNCVTWRQAQTFAKWVGARLPTEAEWELAAKGTKERTYPWGEDQPTCEHLSYADRQGREGCGEAESQAPCGYPRGLSPEGVCDLAGNLWEWVEDDWHRSYHNAPYQGSWCEVKDCSPRSRTYKTYRGGSWYHPAKRARSTARAGALHTTASVGVGFRCAL